MTTAKPASTRVLQGSRFAAAGRLLGSFGGEMRSDLGALFGVSVLLVLVLAALFADQISPYDPGLQSLRARLVPPFWIEGGSLDHILGTDNLGRDILSRLIHGARISLFIAVAVIAISGTIGIALGIYAGYKGGRTDSVIMRVADTQIAFPGLLLSLIVLAMIGPSVGGLILVLCLNEWMLFARVARSATLSMRQMQFVEAAELTGVRTARIIGRHLLPNLIPALLTLSVLEFANVLLAEAGLSFLGVGVQHPDASWGLDVASGKQYIFNAWWLVTMPGIAIALTVLAANLTASWLRITTSPLEHEKQLALRQPPQAAPDFAAAPTLEHDAADRTDVLLRVKGLTVEFATQRGRVQALRGVDLSVFRSETLGIVGESGSGKSVTAAAIMGLIRTPGRISGGNIFWKQQSLLADGGKPGRGVFGKEIAIIFQDPMTSLDPLFTVGDQIGEVLEFHKGMSRAAARARSIELLRLVGITAPEQRVDQRPHQLSGGMRQRVLIAMALACEPELLIADEPTTALDVTVQLQILDLLKSLQQQMGLSIILITHDLGVVARMCDRVAVMYGGKIVEQAGVADIFESPLHPYTRALLRSTPRLADQKFRLESIEGSPPDLVSPAPGCAFSSRCASASEMCRASDPALEPRTGERAAACWLPADARPQGARP